MTKNYTIVDAYRDLRSAQQIKESKGDHYDQVTSAISDLRNAYSDLNTLYSTAQHNPEDVEKNIKGIREKLEDLRTHMGMIVDAHNFCVDLIDPTRDIHNYIGEENLKYKDEKFL